METNIMIYIVEFAVAFMFVGLAYYIGNRYFIGFRLSNMEKKVTDYFTNEGYEWKEEAGCLGIGASVLFPIIGVIIYFAQRKEVKNPGAYLWGALAGMVIGTVLRLATA